MNGLFTVRELAELLQVTKPTVQTAINRLNIQPDKIVKNKYRLYNYDKAIEIIKDVKEEFDLSKVPTPPKKENNEPQSTEKALQNTDNELQSTENLSQKIEKFSQNTENQSQSNEKGELELLKSMLVTIQEQLVIKDKQIAAYEEQIATKDKQISDYSERLAEAMQLTKGQQFITAADKTAQILEKKQEETEADIVEENTQQAKKGFFSRLLKRKSDK